jgi:hypothetical protein
VQVYPGETEHARGQDPEREAAESEAERSNLGGVEGASHARTLDGCNGEPERHEYEKRN